MGENAEGNLGAMAGEEVVLSSGPVGKYLVQFTPGMQLTGSKAAGSLVAMGGQLVVLGRNPEGRLNSKDYLICVLTNTIVAEAGGQRRRCRQCLRDIALMGFDLDGARGLLATCRMCLVGYHPVQTWLKDNAIWKLTWWNTTGG